ncbi:MAG: thiamine-binding protein [Eubacteriales bacterium]|nr:thiamine-binding protein [Eubacteriales bacterium]
MNASIAIQVLPKVSTSEETVRIVDEVIAYIKSFGLHTEVSAFETTIEGDYDTLMEILKNCPKICTDAGAPSVMTYVKISFNPNPGGVLTIDEKTLKHKDN